MVWDGTKDTLIGAPTNFNSIAPGADGKMYIFNRSTSRGMCMVHKPDLKGKACMPEQHAFNLPGYNIDSHPNFCNYNLGALEGSPCDTLISAVEDVGEGRYDIKVYPNPIASGQMLSIDDPKGVVRGIRVYDVMGRAVFQKEQIDALRFAPFAMTVREGLYFYSLVGKRGELLKSGKLVVE